MYGRHNRDIASVCTHWCRWNQGDGAEDGLTDVSISYTLKIIDQTVKQSRVPVTTEREKRVNRYHTRKTVSNYTTQLKRK
jgi:hypothetical protein